MYVLLEIIALLGATMLLAFFRLSKEQEVRWVVLSVTGIQL